MRVLHVIPSLDRRDGGPSIALPHMAASLAATGIEVDVATTIAPQEAAERQVSFGKPSRMEGSWNCYYFPRQTNFYKSSLPLMRWLDHHVRDYQLVHVHAVFSFASIVACKAARHAGVPYIIRPLGLLNQWGMQNRRRYVKALSFRLVEKPLLNASSAIHYTSQREQQEASSLQLKARSVILPLGIDTSTFKSLPAVDVFEKKFPIARNRERILFLSRIDPKKGLELLLQAMAILVNSHPNALLVIAGSGTADYEATLRNMAHELGISAHVLWAGFLAQDDKRAAFAAADIFVLPSKSENFGIALLEAMAAGVPSITTPGVALGEEVAAAGAVLLASHDKDSLAAAMAELLDQPGLRSRLGQAGREIAANLYSLEAMGSNLATLYREIIG